MAKKLTKHEERYEKEVLRLHGDELTTRQIRDAINSSISYRNARLNVAQVRKILSANYLQPHAINISEKKRATHEQRHALLEQELARFAFQLGLSHGTTRELAKIMSNRALRRNLPPRMKRLLGQARSRLAQKTDIPIYFVRDKTELDEETVLRHFRRHRKG